MKGKLISTILALSITSSMAVPVFAAPSDTMNSDVPVVGQIGRWKDGDTDVTDPNNPGSGSGGQNGEINKPDNVTDINVTVPTSMTFDVGTNTNDNNPAFATADYSVINNGTNSVTMSGQYNVTEEGGVSLVDESNIQAKGDGNVQLALTLKAGTKGSEQDFIKNVKNSASSTSSITIGSKQSTNLKFDSNSKGMSDVKEEALKGTFAETSKITKGNLVLTFQNVK